MPLFSEHITNMYYSGTPSYSSPYSYSGSPYGSSYSASYLNSGGNYSNHSSLSPYTRTLSSRYLLGSGRTYSPILSTISEKGTSSPVRINSPRRTPLTSRTYIPSYTSRPVNINTADIDVSREKYRNKARSANITTESQRLSSPINTAKESSSNVADKPDTGVDSSPGTPPQRSTIKRDRPVIRLHTVKRKDRDSPRKPIDTSTVVNSSDETTDKDKLEPLKWRERLADDLAFKNKKEKKTIGEKLVEKFTLKDKDDNDVENNAMDISKDNITDIDLKPASVQISANDTPSDNMKLGRRCSMELLAEQATLLDSLIRRENLSTATLDLSKIGTENIEEKVNKAIDNKKRKFIHQPNPLTTTKSDHSLLSQRSSKRKSLRKSTSGENIRKLDCISETLPLPITENVIKSDESKTLTENKIKKTKLKQKITTSVEISPPASPLKFVVENVTVEEKPVPKKKDIIFSAVIEDVNVNIKPKKATSNAVDTGHRKSVKIKLKSDQNNETSDIIASPEPDDGNFWGKIGKRETVYLTNRKKDLDKAKEEKKRSFCWFPEDNESELKDRSDNIISSQSDSQLNIKTKNENHDVLNKADGKKPNECKIQEDQQSVKEIPIVENIDAKISETKNMPNPEEQQIIMNQTNANEFEIKDREMKNNCDSIIDSVLNINEPSDLPQTKGEIPENDTKKIKIVKKFPGTKENVDKESPEKSISSLPNKGGNDKNDIKKKNIKNKSLPKSDKFLPKSTSTPTIPSSSINKNDISTLKVEKTDSATENGKKGKDLTINHDLIQSTPERKVDTSIKKEESPKEDIKNDQNIQNSSNTTQEIIEVPKIESKTISEEVKNIKDNSALKVETSVPVLQNELLSTGSDNITCEKDSEIPPNITHNTSNKEVITTLPENNSTNEYKTNEVDLLPLNDNTLEETKELRTEENESIITKNKDNDLSNNSIKQKDIPHINPELRLSQKEKTDNIKTDIEKEKENKRESVKRPIPNAGINLFLPKKPVKDVPALKPLIATPRPLQKKPPQVIRSSSSSETSSTEDSSDEDEDDSSESSNDFYECENNADGRTSTGSNDSGFDSSAPTSPSGFSYARKEQSTAYGIFRKTGRFTPPARSIPRFRKYTIDDFQFIKVLGKGSFGKVMLAELRETEYYYAVKCLKKDVVLEDDDVECTLIERKVLALGTNHPYLCHLFATFQTDSHLFFVMEYLNGGDLMFHIQQSGRFAEPRARFYAAEIVSGLKFLHKRGIVYRDLKLDNILLDFDGHVRIADFGMCKLQIYLDKTADTFCGTPDYMAPEIIKGLKYNQTVDWWSFGVLLYEMLIGQSPFSGCDEDELFWSICNEMPSYPRFLSTESLSILTRLLDKDARTRLGGVECMHGDIRDQDFFKPIQWDKLERRELEAPFKPKVRHPLDTQYFDRAFTGERPRLTAVEPQVLRSMDQEPFRGFSYTNPNATDR
ncbi:serine/threonine-protein kinase BCK1/SLK1/SSP31 isoform X3 [Colias croceus]|uniref:serine/threonine-protein kinase BCK1/SLK1/SSP31 isoform X3 n=1 Tax=Colias crocea TaxID=72248 RepID=UPI001E27BEDE|nr:serine/threonine-protein kinase BCK1/SLK1/SSP31 isoform X3 [Colias croceus]